MSTGQQPVCDLCGDTGVVVDYELGRAMGCPRGCLRKDHEGSPNRPAQPLDVSWLPMGDAHPIELSKAGCDPVTGQPAQPGSGEVSRLAFAAGVTLGELHGNESAELQCILRKLIAAQQRIAELESDLENERARGIHTCHDQCQRPLCVAQRRIAELRGCLAELTALVNGESPALLNEDSGGDGELAVRIDNALEDPT